MPVKVTAQNLKFMTDLALHVGKFKDFSEKVSIIKLRL